MSTRTHISLPDALLERVEAARGDVPRSKFITRAIESFVESFEAPTRGNPMASFKVTSPVQGGRYVEPDAVQPTSGTAIPAPMKTGGFAQYSAAGGTLPPPGSSVPMFVCRHGDHRASSPSARCPRHGGKLIPEAE